MKRWYVSTKIHGVIPGNTIILTIKVRENIISHKGNASLYAAGLCVNDNNQHCMNVKANQIRSYHKEIF